jgi:hypothetical protein
VKLINQEGKLFGLVNIIDAAIVIAILLVVAVGAFRVGTSIQETKTAELQELLVTVQLPQLKPEIAVYFGPERKIRPLRSTEYGKIIRAEVTEESETGLSLLVEFTAIGEVFSDAFYVYGERVYLNQEITLETGQALAKGILTGVSVR